MDATEKAQIRKRAKSKFVRSAIVLCVLSALFGGERYLQRYWTDNSELTRTHLEGKAAQLSTELARFYMDRPRLVIECPPPARTKDLGTWAATVQKALEQPVAVFLRTGRTLTWAAAPDELQNGVDLAEASFTADSVLGNRDHPDRRGTMLVSHWSVPPNSANPEWQIWMVGRAEDSVRWGVVLRQRDVWPLFFQRLSRPAGAWPKPLDFNDPAWVLHNELALPASAAAGRFLTTLRAFDETGRVIFASPGLDTTRVVYRSDSKDGRVVDFYQSRLEALQDQAQKRRRLPWLVVIFPLVLIVPFYRWYRQVRALTEPEAPAVVHSESITP